MVMGLKLESAYIALEQNMRICYILVHFLSPLEETAAGRDTEVSAEVLIHISASYVFFQM